MLLLANNNGLKSIIYISKAGKKGENWTENK